MQWVRSAVQRERARQGGASREVTLPSQTTFLNNKYKYNKYRGNPPFSNNFFNNKYKYNKYRGNPPFPNNVFDNKYTIGSTNTNADLKQPQIHKHLKNARGQTNPFLRI